MEVLAGSGSAGFADGAGAAAQFNNLRGVAVDGEGNFIVADSYNHRVRKIAPDGGFLRLRFKFSRLRFSEDTLNSTGLASQLQEG